MDNFGLDILDQMHWGIILMGMVAVFVGSVIQGSTGLGFGMVAAPILLIMNPVFVPGPLLVLAMCVSLLMVFREWGNINFTGLSMALGGRVPGTILAAVTFSAIPIAFYGIVFGVMILAAVVLSVTRWHFVSSSRNLVIAGFASGFMGTLTSVGAPPMALAYQNEAAAVIRSTMAAFFTIGAVISIGALFMIGGFSSDHLFVSAVFIPPLLIGFRVSGLVVKRLNKKAVRLFMLSLSALSAVALIVRSVFALS